MFQREHLLVDDEDLNRLLGGLHLSLRFILSFLQLLTPEIQNDQNNDEDRQNNKKRNH